MAFTTALSGLAAATNNLSVTGNNIANANTTGFKRSRSEFADVYAASFGGVSSITPGSGVRVATVAQQFNQGNLDITSNNLDLAISGEGFFVLGEEVGNTNSKIYTRSGEFKLNKDSIVVNNQGNPLLVYAPNVGGGFSTGVMTEISLEGQQGDPVATTDVTMKVNLDANESNLDNDPLDAVHDFGNFQPDKSETYTAQTSVTTYDSLGVAHTLTTYFVAGQPVPAGREWAVFHYIDGAGVDVNAPTTGGIVGFDGTIGEILTFDNVGQLTAPLATGIVDLVPYTIPSAATMDLEVNYGNSTQYASNFSVEDLAQNGLPTGDLTSIDIDGDGIVFARFSNGASEPLGKVALTRFPNPQGMTKLGDTTWAQSSASGEPIPGEAGGNNFGIIQSGSLESSNVDLAAQLVNLIIAQQTYQANSETISTENQIIQSILNIR